jgi:hypothetical protein
MIELKRIPRDEMKEFVKAPSGEERPSLKGIDNLYAIS